MRTCVIFNPTARGDKAKRLRKVLTTLAGDCALKPTTCPGDAIRLAGEAVREGYEIVVAAGGDGTVSEVVSGLAGVSGGLEQVRLGVLPLGTINVFARELGIPLKPRQAWDCLGSDRVVRVDLPRVEFTSEQGAQVRYFAQLAGAGLDSRAIDRVDWESKKRIGWLAYVIAGYRVTRGTQPKIRVRSDGQSAEGELVLLGNGRFYGGRIPVFPHADPADGLLDVRVFPQANVAGLLRFGCHWLFRGGRVPDCEVHFQAPAVEVESDDPVPFEVDGDNLGPLPARFSLIPRALQVIVAPRD